MRLRHLALLTLCRLSLFAFSAPLRTLRPEIIVNGKWLMAFIYTSRPLHLRVVTLKRKSRAFSVTNPFLLEGLRPIELKMEN